jgi:hypothetical protein
VRLFQSFLFILPFARLREYLLHKLIELAEKEHWNRLTV